MRSSVTDIMPPKVRRALKKLGADIDVARRKRQLTVEMMAERIGVAKSTYQRVAKGDPAVSVGVYVMCLFVLGFEGIGDLADARGDDIGLLLEQQRLPQRIRVKKDSEGGAV